MEEYNVKLDQSAQGNQAEKQGANNLPSQVSVWTKIKNFLFQEVNQNIDVELTPKQEKVFKEVHDFWHQDVTFKGFKDFLFQKIEITL